MGTELRDDSGSDVYDDSRFAPVSTPPPRFLSFGIPPANIPANCGGCSIPVTPPSSLLLWSLLLRALFPPGTGGANPPGLDIPGTAGADAKGDGPEVSDTFPIIGADRSFVTAFFNCFPFEISDRRAPLFPAGGLEGSAEGIGGGGGPGPFPGIGGGGGGGGGMAICKEQF